MNSDFIDLLKLLEKWKVDYAIIGGYAVMEYSEPRATKDLDILISCSKINANKIYSALKEFGGLLTGIDKDFFSIRGRFYKIGRPPNRIDIITSAQGASFTEIKSERVKKLTCKWMHPVTANSHLTPKIMPPDNIICCIN